MKNTKPPNFWNCEKWQIEITWTKFLHFSRTQNVKKTVDNYNKVETTYYFYVDFSNIENVESKILFSSRFYVVILWDLENFTEPKKEVVKVVNDCYKIEFTFEQMESLKTVFNEYINF